MLGMMKVVTGTTTIDYMGNIDDSNMRPSATALYFTHMVFFSDLLVSSGIDKILPSWYATDDGKFWTVQHVSFCESPFFWSNGGNSLFVCRDQNTAETLCGALAEDQGDLLSVVSCCDLLEISKSFCRGSNIYIQMQKGGIYQSHEIPVMRLAL